MAYYGGGNNSEIEFPQNSPLSPPSPPPSYPSIPFNLCGFHTGDTVQVRGDTGELQFSVQINLRREDRRSDDQLNSLEANLPDTPNFRDSVQSSPPSSPYLTPTSSTSDLENHNNNSGCSEASPSGGVMTRLRSGALSPMKYYFGGIYGAPGGSPSSGKKRKSNKAQNVFDEMLRRRSLPLRPCSSYAFFLMKNWGVVKRSSFVETSKKLSKQWSDLPRDMKKEYEDMSLKDYARYKRQCLLLRDDVEQQITSSCSG